MLKVNKSDVTFLKANYGYSQFYSLDEHPSYDYYFILSMMKYLNCSCDKFCIYDNEHHLIAWLANSHHTEYYSPLF